MAMAPEQVGIGIRRHFTKAGVHPYETVAWERRDARIPNYKSGGDAFFQPRVEFPVTWSQNATNIVAQKYFRGQLGTPGRESSLRQVIDRVADTIADWGVRDGYFVDEAEADAFRDELKYLLVNQRAAFNSPVWFNIGVKGVPAQASACFILAVEDTMSSILNWYVEEGTIFKGGSGSGINLSTIRSSLEPLGGGGTASGPVSFMRGADASAGTIKCLHADTELVTDHGSVPIRSVAPGWRVLTRHGLKTVTAVHDNGSRPLCRVRTALGDEILCTAEHRFRVRTPQGEMWREAGELRADDYLIVDLAHTDTGSPQPLLVPDGEWAGSPTAPAGAEAPALPDTLDEAFAVWLGWAHGEGRLKPVPGSGALAVHLDGEDRALVERYRAFTTSVFGPGAVAGAATARGGAAPPASLCVPAVARYLQDNGLWRVGAASVPRPVRSSPATVRAAFLAGLFESDGHVQHGCPTLWTRRRSLALDVHRLLLSVGIPSKVSQVRPPIPAKLPALVSGPLGRGISGGTGVREALEDDDTAPGTVPTSGPGTEGDTGPGRGGLWRVRVVSGEGVRRFAKLVGFVSEGKARLLETAIEVAKEEPEAFEANRFFPHVDAELDRSGARLGAGLRMAIGSYRQGSHPYGMSLARAARLAAEFPTELDGPLARFARGEEFYVPATVEGAGAGPTFDLTVEDVHEYLVNSIVTHNSGGKTRRAAKMVILNADHPDIEQFIWCKAVEERKARALAEAGFDMDLDGTDSHSIQYQNANNSVRATDEFMQAVVDDADWDLNAVTTGEAMTTVKARALLRQISEAAWECADPGMQFDTTINRWHTASNTGRINASNPCSEYMHLDNSACNLASLNLLKFLDDDGSFDVEGFKAAVEVVFTAQEILVGNADYPTPRIGETSRAFRQLGIGYANLGALLMAQGLPYDSDAGRAWAGAITALMTGHSYATSARTAGRMGPFAGFPRNREPMLNVLRMHRAEVDKIDSTLAPGNLVDAARQSWDDAVEIGEVHGVRNSQASVLAPTGTIGLMMDCDTTGVEPDLALTKAKKLVGGGTMFIVNHTVPRALGKLGYSQEQVEAIVAWIDEHKTILGAPKLRAEHLPVFACAMGDNPIHYMGHVRMMAAVQPFISGAISKTINMPEEATVEDVEDLHIEAWRMGLKAIAIYRDNCKVAQPLSTQKKAEKVVKEVERVVETIVLQEPVRKKLPRKRNSKTFSFRVADCHGYATVGEYEDGRPGEIFLKVAKQGSTLAGIMDAFAISVSHGLQYGVPLKAFVEMFINMRFEPAGITDDPDIRLASSLVDYIFRRLAVEYLSYEDRADLGILTVGERSQPTLPGVEEASIPPAPSSELSLDLTEGPPAAGGRQETGEAASPPASAPQAAAVPEGARRVDAPYCYNCGMEMQRAGSCYVCSSCGATSGCS